MIIVIYHIYHHDRFDDSPILSRKKAKVTDLTIDTSGWDEYNSKFSTLLDKYEKTKILTKYAQKKLSEDYDEISFSEEESNSPNEESTLSIEAQSFKYIKPPIEDFFPGSFESLPEAAKTIFTENKD